MSSEVSAASHQQMQRMGRALQLFAELRRRDVNEGASAFGEIASMERGDAILGHDKVDVRA